MEAPWIHVRNYKMGGGKARWEEGEVTSCTSSWSWLAILAVRGVEEGRLGSDCSAGYVVCSPRQVVGIFLVV